MLSEQSLRVATQSVEHPALTIFFGTPLQDFLPSLSFYKKLRFLREPKEGGVYTRGYLERIAGQICFNLDRIGPYHTLSMHKCQKGLQNPGFWHTPN